MNVPTTAKRITITLSDQSSRPVFEFMGDWIGHDIKVVRHHIWRSYQLHNLEIRKQANEPIKEESNAGIGK